MTKTPKQPGTLRGVIADANALHSPVLTEDRADRYATALKVAGWTAASLAERLSCHPRTCQKWLQAGPPENVLIYVEAVADLVESVPVPTLVERRGHRLRDD